MSPRRPRHASASPWPLLCAAVLAAGAGACRCAARPAAAPPPSPLLGSVEVTPAPELRQAGAVDERALAETVRARLLQAGVFGGPAPDAGSGTRPVARVRVALSAETVLVGGKAAARASVRLRVDLRPEGTAAPHFREDVQAASESFFEPGPASAEAEAIRRLLARTVEDVVAGYVARQRLWLGELALVRAALHGDGGELRVEAIRAVGGRRLRDEVPTLLDLLSDEDEVIRDAALGALVGLHERRAVSVLTRQRSMRDGREMRKILDAIASIGGDEAADYLGFVAAAHDEEEIRDMARAALARMSRKHAGKR